MAEAFKYLYNEKFINSLSLEIKRVYPQFDSRSFCRSIFNKNWDNKELKERMRHISLCLNRYLPKDFSEAIAILKAISRPSSGFEFMIFPDYVELFGLHDFDEAMKALQVFTEASSSEFAVRPFIIKYGDKMMAQMKKWADSENEHHRRLASEGCRPRLPWAISLPVFKKIQSQLLKSLRN